MADAKPSGDLLKGIEAGKGLKKVETKEKVHLPTKDGIYI